jgi:kynurenine formamidase
MPVYPIHQKTFIFQNITHDECKKKLGSNLGFATRNILINEHGPTHCDAVYEYDPMGATIDKMPLSYFWGLAICVDLSNIPSNRYIEPEDIQKALDMAHLEINKGDILLMNTGHYKRSYGKEDWLTTYTGLSYKAARWIAQQGVVNIGVDAPSIDHPDDTEFSGHKVCKEFKITNTENLCNLEEVKNKRFLFFGLPLKIRDGTGSPIRAVALLED